MDYFLNKGDDRVWEHLCMKLFVQKVVAEDLGVMAVLCLLLQRMVPALETRHTTGLHDQRSEMRVVVDRERGNHWCSRNC